MGIPVPDTGSVTEDASGASGITLITSGDIDYLVGVDDEEWTVETLTGEYGGSLTIDENGAWTYKISNDTAEIQALNDGDILEEVFDVTSANGPSTITITINGATDPPCFVAGTMIDTPFGPRAVETLRAGDLVLTRDHGPQAIRWVGGSDILIRNPQTARKFQPVRIRAGAFGPGFPERDLLLSPMHRLLLSHPDVPLLFGQSEVMCSAKSMVNGYSILQEPVERVTYVHLLFDSHQVVSSSGCASESFYPGTVALDGLDMGQREEMFHLFPDLRSLPQSYGPAARMVLRGYEARLLRDRFLPEIDDKDSGQSGQLRLGNA